MTQEAAVVKIERSSADREALVKQWAPTVRTIAYRYIGKLKRWYEIDDLLSIGLQQLWHASAIYDPNHEPKATFGTYAHYSVFGRYQAIYLWHMSSRRREERWALSLDEAADDGSPVRQFPAPETPADRELMLTRDRAVLEAALLTLMPREREVIRGRFVDDRPLSDLAEQYGISRERVRQLEARSLQKLRNVLGSAFPHRLGAGRSTSSCYLAGGSRGSKTPRASARKVATDPGSP